MKIPKENFSKKEKELMLKLFRVYAPSRKEKPVRELVKSFLEENHISYIEDSLGNVYSFKNKGKPLLSAHMDCVGGAESGFYVKFVDFYNYKDDIIMKGIGNIGGDDKCGVFMILISLLRDNKLNFIFSIEEEIQSANGIRNVMSDAIKDEVMNEVIESIPFSIVLDRRSYGDIICLKNKYGTENYDKELSEIGKKYGFESVVGGLSDANEISKHINCCNLSSGYFNPHQNTEFVSLNCMYNTFSFVQDMLTKSEFKVEKIKTQPLGVDDNTAVRNWRSYYGYDKKNGYYGTGYYGTGYYGADY